MVSYFLKGILIGLMFGLPVGAVGAMTIQRTLSLGVKAGLLTGLGSSVADCCYATVGAFGITLVSGFLLAHQTTIHVLGGSLLFILGIRLFLKQAATATVHTSVAGGAKLFLSSFAIGITNPASILTFLFAFSYFNVSGASKLLEGVALVCGVFLGTYFWWGAVTFATYVLAQKAAHHSFLRNNKLFGAILTAFGAVICVESFFR